jgi:hypothetical protein
MKYNKLLACEKKNFQKTKQTNYYVQPQKCSTCSKTKIKNLFFDISSLIWCVCVYQPNLFTPRTNKQTKICDGVTKCATKKKQSLPDTRNTHADRPNIVLVFLSPHSSSFKRNQT